MKITKLTAIGDLLTLTAIPMVPDSRPRIQQPLRGDTPVSEGIIPGADDHIELPTAVQGPGLGNCEQAPASDDDQITMRYALSL
jgi:hypothetical protein